MTATSLRVCTHGATALAIVTLVGCGEAPEAADAVSDDHVAVHWGYEPEDGPTQWATMDPGWSVCADGTEQSPIDLTGAIPGTLPDAEIDLPSGLEVEIRNQEGVFAELDNGHTVQVNAATGETLTVGDATYSLVQFHFHAPSEHTVDGAHYPMEMHFVHQGADGALAVVGLLIEEGMANPGLAPIWAHLDAGPGSEATVEIPINLRDDLFRGDASGVWHYQGSLTTPPCSQDVRWLIRRTPTTLSAAQIAEFTAVYDHNNRPVQPLHDRTLYLDENPRLTIR